jgi:pilus assembly protein Flp/PilA
MQRFTGISFIAGQATRFARDDNGATAIEYAMIAAGVGAAVASAVMALGTAVKTLYETVGAGFD